MTTTDNADPAVDQHVVELFKRAAELRNAGLSRHMAFRTAEIEDRISQWPECWGDEVHALIFGDFEAPDHNLEYPALGITVEATRRENTFIRSAVCVLNARVRIAERSVPAVLDAVLRLNTFLGIWSIIDWGNRSVGWWCALTSRPGAGLAGSFKQEGIEQAQAGLERLPEGVRRKVRAALYWIREPKRTIMESYRVDIFSVYAGYWNAFECLVEAVCMIRPQNKRTKLEKRIGIEKFIAGRKGRLDVKSLQECYRLFVEPGFPSKASHVLHVCCPDRANAYIAECFHAKPEEERLYAVRNAINHGDIDPDDVFEWARVEERLWRLKMIVLAIFGWLVPFAYPADSGYRHSHEAD